MGDEERIKDFSHEEEEIADRIAEEIWVRHCASELGTKTVANLKNEYLAPCFTLAEAFVDELRVRRSQRGPRGGVAGRY